MESLTTNSSILSWRIPWTEETGGLQSIGSQKVGQDRSDLTCTILRKNRTGYEETAWYIFLHMLRKVKKEVPKYIYFGFFSSLRFQKLLVTKRCLDPECLSNSSMLRNKWIGVSVLVSLIDPARAKFFSIRNLTLGFFHCVYCVSWG